MKTSPSNRVTGNQNKGLKKPLTEKEKKTASMKGMKTTVKQKTFRK